MGTDTRMGGGGSRIACTGNRDLHNGGKMNATDRITWAKTSKGTRIGTVFDMVFALRDGGPQVPTLMVWLMRQAHGVGFDFDPHTRGSVRAEINHGRWIARCLCGGAEDVAPAEPVFYCLSCGNADNDGRVMTIEFPADRAAIEEALLKRPEMETRNWLPGESVDDLITENRKHGLDEQVSPGSGSSAFGFEQPKILGGLQ